jgi:hypothetical protein
MIIKDYNIDCVDIECWNLDENDEEYWDGVNDGILINCRTWDGEKIKEFDFIHGMNVDDGFLLQRILSEYGYLNVTVSVTTNNYDYWVYYVWE